MDTVERLITSTQELLWDRGYVGTSPKAIQQHAQAGQGSMYHHFAGKSELALAAISRSAAELREEAESALSGAGTAVERISAYLDREREILRGCRVGRLAQDPDVVASEELRRPVGETFDWLRDRLAQVLAEGKANGELAEDLDPVDVAAAVAAVVQGGYVLARAAGSEEPFTHAVAGVRDLLLGKQL
ncbi:TetR/AcrR family transcriptional regulator [Amycolatopsis acidiphila]|uniref:TetR/AcrR family transcriptional regulator n=1 Tax=Amycolatopsis acidiphila TaxID=715473 RepID=A0A557ZQ99_9PSEU|nr:TetR/AcrR family transcriptional regulator [Amycolatopsis acidiphila]TVT14168.1 TetR/AcrR family transcriptional regulator [Amycolatopsis acidiphila]UIJ59228.1 TetR/AcrR family transcriptional regulator [Amycolatopsis acidiphila]GHG79254.1 TetR family transcriptional regulator [Amycolatopsis acidiphila]